MNLFKQIKKAFNSMPHLTYTGVVVPNDVLKGAHNQLGEVVVIGRELDGSLYIASSHDTEIAMSLIEDGRADLAWRPDESTQD